MNVLKLDVLDGAGEIEVCVSNQMHAQRLERFMKWAQTQAIERDAAIFCVRELMRPIAGCQRDERFEQARALLAKT
jgi:hypothetical protein